MALWNCGPWQPAIKEQLEQKRIHAEPDVRHQHAAIAVLNIGWMDHGMQQPARGCQPGQMLLALDLLARVLAGRIVRHAWLAGSAA